MVARLAGSPYLGARNLSPHSSLATPKAVVLMRALALRFLLLCAATLAAARLGAAEPNNNFSDASVLAPGVLTVSDGIAGSPTPAPDTTLGAFDESGTLILTDDDGSSFGNGFASGLFGVPINGDGSIELALSGFFDLDFDGLDDRSDSDHFEQGGYELYVDVFDSNGLQVASLVEPGALATGAVDRFSFADSAWTGGSFNAEVDNFVNIVPGDVDFYRFSGLPPGKPFVAEILSGSFDTVLALFDDTTGGLIIFDDDGGEGLLSRVDAVAPSSGEIVLAVSGYDDFGFVGAHQESGEYTLVISVIPEPVSCWLALWGMLSLLLIRAQAVSPA